MLQKGEEVIYPLPSTTGMDDETLKTNLEVAAAAADDHMTMDLANEVR